MINCMQFNLKKKDNNTNNLTSVCILFANTVLVHFTGSGGAGPPEAALHGGHV